MNADGTFELKAVVGPVVLSIGTLTGDWTLKTVELEWAQPCRRSD